MLIQHLLTERIFRTIFNNPDFTRRNVIAVEIEKVIDSLTSKSFSRQSFLQSLDYFYRAIEETAATLSNFSQKQRFLNAIYEKFFQGFSVKVADTHGIVYTPQPIVNFMVKSVEDILQKEFGKSLSDKGIHIIDPFVGTGNFIVQVMQQIRKTALPYKYEHELHCNEVMLLPYYISSMNIEHEYWELTGEYKPFSGICLVDTFELVEEQQLSLFTTENTARVERQRQSKIDVVFGNPPYNTGQNNENDNNKNRKYKIIDRRVAETYAKDSKATNKNALSDPYIKAIRWASDRISEDGIIAFVTNNSFLDKIAFDGMRKHLRQDFNRIYTFNLHGDIRQDSMRDGIALEKSILYLACLQW
jgi:predicted helicase